jgi:hypothetical protein
MSTIGISQRLNICVWHSPVCPETSFLSCYKYRNVEAGNASSIIGRRKKEEREVMHEGQSLPLVAKDDLPTCLCEFRLHGQVQLGVWEGHLGYPAEWPWTARHRYARSRCRNGFPPRGQENGAESL